MFFTIAVKVGVQSSCSNAIIGFAISLSSNQIVWVESSHQPPACAEHLAKFRSQSTAVWHSLRSRPHKYFVFFAAACKSRPWFAIFDLPPPPQHYRKELHHIKKLEVRIRLQPNFPILSLLTGFHKFAKSLGPKPVLAITKPSLSSAQTGFKVQVRMLTINSLLQKITSYWEFKTS